MKKNNSSSPDDFDSFFKDKLEGGHMEPSPGLWDKIESELEDKKKPSLLFPGLGALILLALGISLGVYFFGSKTKDAKRDQIIAQNEKKKNEEKVETVTSDNTTQQSEPVSTSQQESEVSSDTQTKPSSNSNAKTSKTENKANEQTNYTATTVKQEVNTSPAQSNSAKEESVKTIDQNEIAENTTAKNQVKPETENSNGEKEKSNRVEKALPVLGSTMPKTKTNDEAKNSNVKNNEGLAADQPKQENAVATKEEKKEEQTSATNPDQPVAVTENKTDDPKTEEVTKSTDLPAKVHQPDSLPADDYGKLALNVGIGFNQILPSTISTMGATEKYLISFGDEFKVQFRPCKFVSFNIGAGYSFYKIQRDATDFSFDRDMDGDYVFNTTIGNISMDHNTLLQGYDSNPNDVLNAKYSYFSTIDFINLPIEIQGHFINGKKFRMWAGAGLNGAYVLSQNTRFSVIKDNSTQTYNYSEVFLNKVNAYATLSLGCDIKFRDKMFFYISPSYRYGLTNMSRGTGLNFKPQALMGIVGVKFILK